MVRFPPDMRDLIRDTADANGRSMNTEIIDRLAQTFSQAQGWSAEDVIKRLVLAMDESASDSERAAAKYQALTFLARAPIEAAKAVKAWEELRPAGHKKQRLSPLELAEIETVIEAMLKPEMETIVRYLRNSGWTVEPPEADE
ncbi:Arc family DNA-binding protein [Devosia sp. PTR5]|uniref:Arc family DNA-binding protein n=2 Tax=Devosia oryzisoli TaxID=2774138 RepID=A0A927ISM2_9HYPH|nr:Arc family DNA-binding protein [Devosia oryzisoli]